MDKPGPCYSMLPGATYFVRLNTFSFD